MWYNDINKNRVFRNVSLEYDKTSKRIAELCTWDSNYSARESRGVAGLQKVGGQGPNRTCM